MDFELQWMLWALPLAFGLGWWACRLDGRQTSREAREAPKAYVRGLSLLLDEQQDKAIDVFIEAVQRDPDTVELHFALGGLFRRRGEFERAVRVHEHLLGRADLSPADRERARFALAQDFMRAGLFDRAEAAFAALQGGAFDVEARLAVLTLHERSRDWPQAVEAAQALEGRGAGSFATRVAHHRCEQALQAQAAGHLDEAQGLLRDALAVAPSAARPRVLAGTLALQAGQPRQALHHWDALREVAPGAFALVAAPYAQAAQDAGCGDEARQALLAAYEHSRDLDVLIALIRLDERTRLDEQGPSPASPSPGDKQALLWTHLAARGGLDAVAEALNRPPASWPPRAAADMLRAVTAATAGARRYRCAACGFEARQYFWQCPGCQGWDTFPPAKH
jgi:lipopolysaccharide biosynthesis regulator YciM